MIAIRIILSCQYEIHLYNQYMKAAIFENVKFFLFPSAHEEGVPKVRIQAYQQPIQLSQ